MTIPEVEKIEDNIFSEGDYTKEYLDEWRQSFNYLEDSLVLEDLDVEDLEILDELFIINQDELPPYSFLSKQKKKKFFKKLTENYYEMNKPGRRSKRKSIKIKEEKNTTFGKGILTKKRQLFILLA